MKTLRYLLATLLLAATLPVFAGDGINFTSPDGRLSFWAPKQPTSKIEEFPSASGAPNHRTTYAVESRTFMLLAGIVDFGNGPPTTEDEEYLLDGMLQDIRNGLGSRYKLDAINGDTPLTLEPNHFKGKQLRGIFLGQQMTIRAYVGPNGIYMAQASYPVGDAEGAKIIEHFLNSMAVHGQ